MKGAAGGEVKAALAWVDADSPLDTGRAIGECRPK